MFFLCGRDNFCKPHEYNSSNMVQHSKLKLLSSTALRNINFQVTLQ